MFRRFSWSGELTESSMKTSTCQATNTMFTWYFNQHHFTRFTITIIVSLLLLTRTTPQIRENKPSGYEAEYSNLRFELHLIRFAHQ